MYTIEKGVLKNSDIYFHTPSNIARSLFFFIICAGEFFCDGNYRVERETYNSFLIMYIRKGNGFVSAENRTYQANAGDVVILDCHRPHLYYTKTGWETLWVHFDGNISKELFELIYNRVGNVLPAGNSILIPHCISVILESFRKNRPLPEAVVSCHIHRMLTEMLLLASNGAEPQTGSINPVLDAITHIHANFHRRITLNELAESVKISPYHFSRLFKKETGYSPYEYVLKTRIDHAKVLLKKTELSVKEIAFKVGFNSESNFINTFSSRLGLTPNEFRSTPV